MRVKRAVSHENTVVDCSCVLSYSDDVEAYISSVLYPPDLWVGRGLPKSEKCAPTLRRKHVYMCVRGRPDKTRVAISDGIYGANRAFLRKKGLLVQNFRTLCTHARGTIYIESKRPQIVYTPLGPLQSSNRRKRQKGHVGGTPKTRKSHPKRNTNGGGGLTLPPYKTLYFYATNGAV